MGEHDGSIPEVRTPLWPLAVGALVAGVTMLPYLVPERPAMPVYVSVPLAVVSIVAMPGIMLSMVLSGSTHDPKLLLAAILNAALYGGLFYWIANRRRRRRKRSEMANS